MLPSKVSLRPKVIAQAEGSPRPASPTKRIIIRNPLSPTKQSIPPLSPAPTSRLSSTGMNTDIRRSGSPTKSMGRSLKSAKSMPALRREVGGSEKVVVCLKVKPTNNQAALQAYDISEADGTIALSDDHPQIQKRGGKKSGSENMYSFDTIHLPPHPTSSLYTSHIQPLVHKAMQGFNSTIFAYGMTGCGKTYVMSGGDGEGGDVGIIPLAVEGVFEGIEADPSRHFLLRVSYIEIYNETLRDLLNTSKKPLSDSEKPSIHLEHGIVQVSPLVEEIVRSPEEVLRVLKKGENNRRSGATDWNERSSRSHCVFTITIESRARAEVRESKLTLIDLAGSERATANKERLAEGKFINKSLLALGMVIEQLADKSRKPGSFVGYRNSKPTHLLEGALGGNANVAVICTLSLEEHHQAEALETLRFAARCSQVETKAKQGIVLSSEKALLKAKEDEILILKGQLEAMAATPAVTHDDHRVELFEQVQGLESRKDRLLQQLASLNGDILTSAGLTSGHRAGRLGHRQVSEHVVRDVPGSPTKVDNGQALPHQASRRIFSVAQSTLTNNINVSAGLEHAFIRSMQQVRLTERKELEALRHELQTVARERDSLERSGSQLAGIHKRLEDESRMKAEVQQILQQEKEKNKRLEKELYDIREERNDLRRQLSFAERIHAVKAASLPRTGESNLPLPATAPNIRPALKSRETGSLQDFMIGSSAVTMGAAGYDGNTQVEDKHREATDRLELVIRGMKTTNDALMGKVAEWRQRVLDQNALIQSLTTSTDSLPSKTPERSRELLPTSKTNASTTVQNSPSNKIYGTPKYGRIAGGNDAFASPPPMPMTPGMESSPSRGHRRVTVQRDLMELQASPRVDSARMLFGGRDAGTERTKVVLPSPRRS